MARDTRVKTKQLTVREELASIRGLFEGHIDAEGKWQKSVQETNSRVEGKVDRILNVRINGTEGFENVIALLWSATAGARLRMKVRKALQKWTDEHPSVSSALLWLFKKCATLLLAIIVVWLMYRLGLGQFVEHVLRITVPTGG